MICENFEIFTPRKDFFQSAKKWESISMFRNILFFKMKSEILINYSIDMCWICPCTRVNVLELFPIPNPKHEILDSVELGLVKCHMGQSSQSYFFTSPLREDSNSMLLSTVNMCMHAKNPNINLSWRCHHSLLLVLKSWKLNTTLGCLENFSFIGSLHIAVRFEHNFFPMCEWHPEYYVCTCWIGMFHGNAHM
jgi:hypothetical protein